MMEKKEKGRERWKSENRARMGQGESGWECKSQRGQAPILVSRGPYPGSWSWFPGVPILGAGAPSLGAGQQAQELNPVLHHWDSPPSPVG